MTESAERSGIFGNTLARSSPVLTTFVFSFLLAPLMLNRLGLAQFGVWAVTGALAQYSRLLDLGITSSLGRFVALYDAEGDRARVEQTVGIGILAALGVGLVALVGAALGAPIVSDVVGVLGTGDMRIVLLCSATISVAYLLSAVLDSVPVGLRRMGPPSIAETATNTLNFVVSVVVLLVSTDLTAYAIANAGAAVVGVGFAAIALSRVWSAPYARRPSPVHARGIVSFGVKSQLVNLAQLVNTQTDKLIIAGILGARAAGAYDIANRVVQGVLSLGLITLAAMVPTMTADLVRRGRAVILEYFQRYTTRSLAVGLPLLGALSVSAPYLLVAWLGESPPDTSAIVVMLSLAFSVSFSTGVATTLVVSDGHPGLIAQTATIVVVLNIAATLVAAPVFGLWGVLVATVLADAVASAIFLVRFHRRYGIRARVFVAAVAPPLAVAVLAAAPFALWYLLAGVEVSSRLPAVIGVACTGGLYGIVCWLVESRLGLLPEKLRIQYLRRRLARG